MISDEDLKEFEESSEVASLPWTVKTDGMGCWVVDANDRGVIYDPTLEDAAKIVYLVNWSKSLLGYARELQDLLARFRNDSEAYQMGRQDGAKEQHESDMVAAKQGYADTYGGGDDYDIVLRVNTNPLVTDRGVKK